MAKGRKPKPTAAKALAGNPGHRALNKKEPKFQDDGMLECPDYLDAVAREEWERVTSELQAAGVITQMDKTALAAYCVAFSHWLEAEEELKKNDWTFTTDKGRVGKSPWVGMADKYRDQVIRYAAEFGMTPSSRSRVSALPNREEDELEKSLFGLLPVTVVKGKGNK